MPIAQHFYTTVPESGIMTLPPEFRGKTDKVLTDEEEYIPMIVVLCALIGFPLIVFLVNIQAKNSFNLNFLFSGAIYVAADDFQKLLAKTEEPIIFSTVVWRKHYYLTAVKGMRILLFRKKNFTFPKLLK